MPKQTWCQALLDKTAVYSEPYHYLMSYAKHKRLCRIEKRGRSLSYYLTNPPGYLSTKRGKEQSCWLILSWDFSIDITLYVMPVSGDQQLVADLTKIILKKLSGLELPVRGTLDFAKDYSKEEIKLADSLYSSILIFRQMKSQ